MPSDMTPEELQHWLNVNEQNVRFIHNSARAWSALKQLTARIAELEEKLNVMAGREHRVAEVDMNLVAREIHLDHRISDFEARLAGTEGPIAESELEVGVQYLGWSHLNSQWETAFFWGNSVWGNRWNTWRCTQREFEPIRKFTLPAAAEGGETNANS